MTHTRRRRSENFERTGTGRMRRPLAVCAVKRPPDIPVVVDNVVSVGSNDVYQSLLASIGVNEVDSGTIRQNYSLPPVVCRSIKGPEGTGEGDAVIAASLGQQILIVGCDSFGLAEGKSGKPLRPDAEVVGDVAHVGHDGPAQVGVSQ